MILVLTKPTKDEEKQPKPEEKSKGSKKNPAPQTVGGDGEYKCLIRATDGKTKISTIVRSRDVVRFQLSFAAVNKANMDGLKKRERKRRGRKKDASKKPTAQHV